jgi:hypothetical protein
MTSPINPTSRVWAKFPGLRVAHAFSGGQSLCGSWSEPAGIRYPRLPHGSYLRHCLRCQRKAGLSQ